MSEPNQSDSGSRQSATLPNASPVPKTDGRRWRRRLLCFGGTLAITAVLATWWFVQRPVPVEALTYSPAGTDESAKRSVEEMLQVNKPWLEPRNVIGKYELQRTIDEFSLAHGIRRQQETLGPFTIGAGCNRAVRIGSIVYTPLHAMLREPTGYKVRMLGQTRWRGIRVIGVDVSFEPSISSAVGLGGQANTSYSSSSYRVDAVRMLIDPQRSTPLVLWTSATHGSGDLRTRWEFEHRFFKLQGGLAPRAFDWSAPDIFREHQEFQISGENWVFKRGYAVISNRAVAVTPPTWGQRVWQRIKRYCYRRQELRLSVIEPLVTDAEYPQKRPTTPE